MKIHVFRVWNERLNDDQVFDDESVDVGLDKGKCIVSDDNLVEFMEALDVQNIVTEDELRGIIRISSAKPKKVDLKYIIEKEASGADDS